MAAFLGVFPDVIQLPTLYHVCQTKFSFPDLRNKQEAKSSLGDEVSRRRYGVCAQAIWHAA